jgi:hypothetical protein
MRLIISAIILFLLFGCDTTPQIIPDTTPDNAIILGMKDRINEPGAGHSSYSWVFWYVPILIIALLWAYREYIRKPLLCDDGEQKDEVVETKNTPSGV